MPLTRYLYNKSSVIISLRNAIHEAAYEPAVFWAYELYYSGFEKETIEILLDIYKKRFLTNHPKLGLYIRKKLAETKEECIATIVKNLTMKRPDTVETADVKFVNVKAYHIEPYKTLAATTCIKWKYLQTVCKYAVCKEKLKKPEIAARLSLFRDNWLYHASLSPIWLERIKNAGGIIEAGRVTFASEDDEESFYDQYGFEPDEQPLEIQQKCMGI
jgi:hypothetical protein